MPLLQTTINAVAPWEGQLVWVGNFNEGVSQNGSAYAFADFTLKYQDYQMRERFVTFQISGVDRVNNLKSYPLGTYLHVSWFPDAREYSPQGQETRWFPCFAAFNVRAIQPQQQQPQAYPQAQPQQVQQQYAQPAPAQPYGQGGFVPTQPSTPAPAPQPAPAPAPAPVQTPAPSDDLPF